MQAGSEVGDSALCEIGNILGTAYLNGLSAMTGMSLGPRPPHLTTDMLGAIVASLLAQTSGDSDAVLVLDSELDLQNDPCSITFLLLPSSGGVTESARPARSGRAGVGMTSVRMGEIAVASSGR